MLDDYAHHPAEVRATLAAVRASFKRRVVAVFQPHRYTRLRDLFDDFLWAFDDADMLCLMDIYPAGEEAIAEVSSQRLYEAMRARGHLDVRLPRRRGRSAPRAIAAGSRCLATWSRLSAPAISTRWAAKSERDSSAEVKVHEGA